MSFVTSSDVALLHAAIAGESSELDDAIGRCVGIAPGSQDAKDWAELRKRVAAYLADGPSFFRAGTQMDEGQALQREMAPWHDTLRSHGCDSPREPVVAAPSLIDATAVTLANAGKGLAALSSQGTLGPVLLLGLGLLVLHELKAFRR